MSKLPKSFGLKEKKRADGRLDLIGKDDAGKEYKAATLDGPEVTPADVERLRIVDREAYSNPQTRAREAVRKLIGEPEKHLSQQEYIHKALTFDESDWIEAAQPIVHAGFERRGSTVGSTWSYRNGWDRIFKEKH
jgi:hypothetical protein